MQISGSLQRPSWIGSLLLGLGMAVAIGNIVQDMPFESLASLLSFPADVSMHELIVRYSILPRIVMAILAGAGLGLAGAIMQEILRNPIASPATLGVSAGAQLALSAVTVWAPSLLAGGREGIAAAGGGLALAIVLLLTYRRGWTPLSLLLAGLIVSLYCGALSAIIVLLYSEYVTALFIWGGGALTQHDWSGVVYLAPRFAISLVAAIALIRPLTLLGLNDDVAKSAGVSVATIRFAGLAIAVFLVGAVVAAVGLIAFIGLAAPALARLAGARRFTDRIAFAPLFGAGLLLLADQLAQAAAGWRADMIPVGAVTASLGAPMILWLLPRLKNSFSATPAENHVAATAPHRAAWPVLGALTGLFLLILGVAVVWGMSEHGPALFDFLYTDDLLRWRWPRVVASAGAGIMLATAGVILQRMLGNPLASPEVLGISNGATLALAVLILVVPETGRNLQTLAASVGAFAALLAILIISRKQGYAGDRVLLTGIALSAFLNAAMAFIMVGGNPAALQLLAWTTGSTYRVDAPAAVITIALSLILIAPLPFFLRWLDILPLGPRVAQSVGVPLTASRLMLLLMASGLTAAGTLIVGPLSFAGLLAPHLARMCGLRRPAAELAGAALAGGIVMVTADWLGRTVLFPWQIPAGLMAMLVGGPAMIWLLVRTPRAG